MNQTKTLSIAIPSVNTTIKYILFLLIAVFAPISLHQNLTGPIVNATLLMAVSYFGFKKAMYIGLIPSLVSISIGLLPGALAPMVPFIIAGNLILMFVFAGLKPKNYWLAVLTGSTLKFVFLFGTSYLIMGKFVSMMAYPQLYSAIIGGILASFFLAKN